MSLYCSHIKGKTSPPHTMLMGSVRTVPIALVRDSRALSWGWLENIERKGVR